MLSVHAPSLRKVRAKKHESSQITISIGVTAFVSSSGTSTRCPSLGRRIPIPDTRRRATLAALIPTEALERRFRLGPPGKPWRTSQHSHRGALNGGARFLQSCEASILARHTDPNGSEYRTMVTEEILLELDRYLGSGRMEADAPLAPLTTFRIGGPADRLFHARTPDDLANAILAARELGIPHFLLGMGANVLFGDRGFRGLVIRSEVGGIEFFDDGRVRAGAGVETHPDLIEATVSRGLGGLHHFVGIPSTVGGAMWQNLHFLSPAPERARTVFMDEVVESAEILSEEGERRTVDREYFSFGYDYSILHERNDVVLTVDFKLSPAPPEELRRVMKENLAWRKTRHPDLATLPSVGSIFKKIEGIGAGRLIDQCGLKGQTEGGAQIFSQHANIIVNRGNATASDVRALIDLAQKRVADELGYELVPEITFAGEF